MMQYLGDAITVRFIDLKIFVFILGVLIYYMCCLISIVTVVNNFIVILVDKNVLTVLKVSQKVLHCFSV